MKEVSSTYIEGLGLRWCYRDQCTKYARTKKAFVINLDSTGGPGTHWTAARVIDGVLYYADPFGTILNGYPPKEFDGYAHRVVNRVSFQRPSSILCGYYAVCFANAMNMLKGPVRTDMFETILWRAIC